jgi:hypothetical protein
MNTKNNVFNKLFSKDKVELSSEKYDFALIDDLKSILNGLENQIFIDKDIYNEFIKIGSDLTILQQKAKERVTSYDSIVQSSFKKIQLAEQYMAQAERISKELGTDVNSIPNYNKVVSARNEAQENIKKIGKEASNLKKLI